MGPFSPGINRYIVDTLLIVHALGVMNHVIQYSIAIGSAHISKSLVLPSHLKPLTSYRTCQNVRCSMVGYAPLICSRNLGHAFIKPRTLLKTSCVMPNLKRYCTFLLTVVVSTPSANIQGWRRGELFVLTLATTPLLRYPMGLCGDYIKQFSGLNV